MKIRICEMGYKASVTFLRYLGQYRDGKGT